MDEIRVTLFIDCPTPQRAPTLNSLAEMGIPFLVAYAQANETTRGWGSVEVDHPHVLLSAGPYCRLFTAARLAANRQTAAVCSFGYWRLTYVVAILIARLRRLPLVIRSDSNAWRDERRACSFWAIKRVALRLLLGRRVTVWTVGESNARYWSALGRRNQVRIPYTAPNTPRATPLEAAALRARLALSEDDFVVLYVGRLQRDKGILDLCEAFSRFSAQRSPSSVLIVVGDGPERASVNTFSESRGRVFPVGPVVQSELGPYFALADLVVVPSRAEPWGLVVNEALGNGRRVLASDAVGAADDLIDDSNGSRFAAGDVEALRSALEREIERGREAIPPLNEPDVVPLFASELYRLLAIGPAGRHAPRNKFATYL